MVGARPHHLRIARAGEPGIQVTVDLVEHLGRSNFFVCTPASDGMVESGRAIVFESDAEMRIGSGERLTITADPAFLVFFERARARPCPWASRLRAEVIDWRNSSEWKRSSAPGALKSNRE